VVERWPQQPQRRDPDCVGVLRRDDGRRCAGAARPRARRAGGRLRAGVRDWCASRRSGWRGIGRCVLATLPSTSHCMIYGYTYMCPGTDPCDVPLLVQHGPGDLLSSSLTAVQCSTGCEKFRCISGGAMTDVQTAAVIPVQRRAPRLSCCWLVAMSSSCAHHFDNREESDSSST
jgi:hypothetical protein